MKRERFIKAVELTKKDRDFNKLYNVMYDVFEIKTIHESVKKYIETTIDIETIEGPVYFDGFGKSYLKASSLNYHYNDSAIPKGKLLPALYIAYFDSGYEYLVFFETGQVFGGFHNSLWTSYFDNIFDKYDGDVNRALKIFENTYGLKTFTYNQFLKMQNICREEYGIKSPNDFPGKLRGADFVKILKKSGKDENGKTVCYIDDIVSSNVLEGLINSFNDFFI